ncbi:filamentous hemagglutinin N-terminal domain-containing protein, partial [Aeromonas dhakensis]|uniref:filamentous hemagglutinin N-terminal domain-containing protein n=1 Tax=Aeromonas dhakensis TaxID=196024 RepID=UPI00111BA1B0
MKMKKISFVIACLMSSIANAAPAGGAFTQGSGSININGTIVDVDIASKIAVIDWNSFNVAQGETVNFNNSGAVPGVAINIDNQGAASQISGAINGNNTSIVILNKDGVNLNGASINATGGFIAAAGTLDSVVDNGGIGDNINITLSNAQMIFNDATKINAGTNFVNSGTAVNFNTGGNAASMPLIAGWGLRGFGAEFPSISGGGSLQGDLFLQNAYLKISPDVAIGDVSGRFISSHLDVGGMKNFNFSGAIGGDGFGGSTGLVIYNEGGTVGIGDVRSYGDANMTKPALNINAGSFHFNNSIIDGVSLDFFSLNDISLSGDVTFVDTSSFPRSGRITLASNGDIVSSANIGSSGINDTVQILVSAQSFKNDGDINVKGGGFEPHTQYSNPYQTFWGTNITIHESLNMINNGNINVTAIQNVSGLVNNGTIKASNAIGGYGYYSGPDFIVGNNTITNKGDIQTGDIYFISSLNNDASLTATKIRDLGKLSNSATGTVITDSAKIAVVENAGLIKSAQDGGLITSGSTTNSGEITQSEEAHKSTLTATSINNTGRIDFGTKAVDPQPPV